MVDSTPASLIDNALKYRCAAWATLQASPAAAVVSAEEDGPGIPEAAMAPACELFHRLQASRNRGAGATGSGLAVARQVVEGYGGALRWANRPGGGLLATARLPREGANGIGGGHG